MGNYIFEDADGGTSEAQYTFGYVKDEAEGSLRIHVFMASVPADGEDLEFAEEPSEANLTEITMEAAQLAWSKKLVEVGDLYGMKGNYREIAEELVDDCYAYSMRPTLFKPAEARVAPFRTSRAGAISYYAGGNINFPEDWGFALRPWKSARLSTEAAVIHGTQGVVMGHAYFDDAAGIQRKAEYAMGFVKSHQGGVRINLHHAHFPNYTAIRSMQELKLPDLQQNQVLEVQKEWGDGIVELGKYGRQVLELEQQDEVEHLVGVHQEHDVNRTVLWHRAANFVDKLYGFTEGPVMLKVTEASASTRFRTTRLGTVSWLIGGNRDFPADRGFALRPWNKVRFDNAQIAIQGSKAQAMGRVALLDDPGNERELEYVFCYVRDLDGRLRIEAAHLALPYGASYRSMWDNIAGGATGAAGAVGYAAKGVAGAVHGAVGLASQGGTGLWVMLASIGVTGAFVYYFVFTWAPKPAVATPTPGGLLPGAGAFPGYPPQGWSGAASGPGGFAGQSYRSGRTSYAQANMGRPGASYAYGNLPQRDPQTASSTRRADVSTSTSAGVQMAEQRAADDLYRKTLRFLVSVAAELAYPKCQLRGGHTLGNGFLYQLEGGTDSDEEVEEIRKKLKELVDSDETIYRVTKPWKKAMTYFNEHKLTSASALLASRVKTEVACYECHGVLRLNLFDLHQKASALKAGSFSLVRCKETPGFVAAYADDYQLQSALLTSHSDHKAFCKGYQVRSVGELNHLSQVGR
eukprot:symbB.v1.2.028010.t1/scaffold2909.1/size67485/2